MRRPSQVGCAFVNTCRQCPTPPDWGLLPTFSDAASAELQGIQRPAAANDASDADAQAIRDLTGLLWASIDNDDSRDLDQLTVAETLPGDAFRIRVAVAAVDALVKDGSAIDAHAHS
jgi:exoribonuclease R